MVLDRNVLCAQKLSGVSANPGDRALAYPIESCKSFREDTDEKNSFGNSCP